MSTDKHDLTGLDVFGPILASYTREEALSDGVLIDASSMAQEASFTIPVAFTATAWQDCVAWTDADSEKQIHQDQSGRLWDVLTMALYGIKSTKRSGHSLLFPLTRVPRDGESIDARETTLKLIIGPGDRGEAVITILLPNED